MSTENSNLTAKVQELKNRITTNAHTIVHDVMPKKVILLDELFSNNKSFNVDLEVLKARGGVQNISVTSDDAKNKKRKLNSTEDQASNDSNSSDTVVPPHPVIMEMLTLLKKEILELIEVINTVKIWIQLNIPRIEDGNNFGVSIQEDTVSELGRAEVILFDKRLEIDQFYQGFSLRSIGKYDEVLHFKSKIDNKDYEVAKRCGLQTKCYRVGRETIHQPSLMHIRFKKQLRNSSRHDCQKFGKIENSKNISSCFIDALDKYVSL